LIFASAFAIYGQAQTAGEKVVSGVIDRLFSRLLAKKERETISDHGRPNQWTH
jgi:hypothetical protein